jgi:nucleoid DNA-binding protein
MDKKDIIEFIARKHNKTLKEVRQAVNSQPECTAHVFRRGKAESIRWPYFGKFDVHPYRLKKLKENSNGKTLRQLEDE